MSNQPSLQQEILDVLRKSGEKLSLADIKGMLSHRIDADSQSVNGRLNNLRKYGHVEAVVVDGRNYYQPTSAGEERHQSQTASAPTEQSAAKPAKTRRAKKVAAPAPKSDAGDEGLAAAESTAIVASMVEAPSAAVPSDSVGPIVGLPGSASYDLFDHIGAALTDLEDLASDAVNRAAAPDVVLGVLAAQGSLRRAQTAIYHALKAR